MSKPNQNIQGPSAPKISISFNQQLQQNSFPQQVPLNSYVKPQTAAYPSYTQQTNVNFQQVPVQYCVIEPPMFEGGEVQQLKLLKPRDNDKKVAAVIISFVNGSSYDALFRTV